MAKAPTLKAKIIDMAHKPDGFTRISVEFNDELGKWFQAFDVKYDRPISIEEFSVLLSEQNLTDPYRYLKEAKRTGDEFTVVRKNRNDDKPKGE